MFKNHKARHRRMHPYRESLRRKVGDKKIWCSRLVHDLREHQIFYLLFFFVDFSLEGRIQQRHALWLLNMYLSESNSSVFPRG